MGLEEIEAAYQLFNVYEEIPNEEDMRDYIEALGIAFSSESTEIREELRRNKLNIRISETLGLLDASGGMLAKKFALEREVLFAELETIGTFSDYAFSIYKGINEANLKDAYKLLVFTGLQYERNANHLEDVREGLSITSEPFTTLDLVCTDEAINFDMFFTKEVARVNSIRPVEKSKADD